MSIIETTPITEKSKVTKAGFSSWAQLMLQAFFDAANDVEHVEPVFNEAAGETDSGGGAKWHGWAPIGLPGAKFHAMTGQMEKSHDVRRARMEGKNFRNEVLQRADYYGAFEKYNSLKM